MLDYELMIKRQAEGVSTIESLPEEEKMMLQYYCSLATDALLQVARQRKEPVSNLVINSFKTGMALGLKLSVTNGQVIERRQP